MRKLVRSSWLNIVLLTFFAYGIGGIVFARLGCGAKPNPHTISACILWFGWDLLVWPIYFVFSILFSIVGLVIYVMVLVIGLWYFFYYEPKRKKLLTENTKGVKSN